MKLFTIFLAFIGASAQDPTKDPCFGECGVVKNQVLFRLLLISLILFYKKIFSVLQNVERSNVHHILDLLSSLAKLACMNAKRHGFNMRTKNN